MAYQKYHSISILLNQWYCFYDNKYKAGSVYKNVIKSFFSLIVISAISGCGNGGSTSADYTPKRVDTVVPAGNNMMSTGRGQEIFQQRCIACHGLSGNAQTDNAANLQMSRIDSFSMALTIKNGRNKMPAFKNAMPDSDISNVIVYVKSLRR